MLIFWMNIVVSLRWWLKVFFMSSVYENIIFVLVIVKNICFEGLDW